MVKLDLVFAARRQFFKPIARALPRISDKNALRILDLAQRFDSTGKYDNVINGLKDIYSGKGSGLQLIRRIEQELSPNSREKLIVNLMLNTMLSDQIKQGYKKKHGVEPPFFFVISPTMRCNLRCTGCYAGNYSKKDDLPHDVFDRLLNEARDMGIYFITISGGEPFIREDLLDMFEKYNDMYFQVYTNGTLIDKKLAKRLARLGNVAPAISIDGFEKETDNRRGKGTYKRVLQAMDHLRAEGVMFGFSCVPTRHTINLLSRERFVDHLIDRGCMFGWIFHYIPVGLKPDVKLMATPEQRSEFRDRIDALRHRKAIFIGDFWNDGIYSAGCISGAKRYFHINVHGDVEPCVFFHFAVDNIKNKPLKDCLNSDFFKAIRREQKSIENRFTPCLIIDNPALLRKVCTECKAHATHPGADALLKQSIVRKHLDAYSKTMAEVTEEKWLAYKDLGWVKRIQEKDAELCAAKP